MKSPIRWAGSKAKLLPRLAEYWSGRGRYIEAFAGSAALFFHLEPSEGALNDRNEELMNAYAVLRKHPRRLYNYLLNLPVNSDFYYDLRRRHPSTLGVIARAARFFYLNRHCFNGIYRTNQSGKFNVPYAGGASTGTFPAYSHWNQCADVLKRVELISDDFESFVLDRVTTNDFVYLDPPYAVSNRRIFSQYSAQTFGLKDIKRLSSVLKEIDRRGAIFLVSYAKSPEAKLLSDGWNVNSTSVQRNVAGFAKHRRRAGEILITNYE